MLTTYLKIKISNLKNKTISNKISKRRGMIYHILRLFSSSSKRVESCHHWFSLVNQNAPFSFFSLFFFFKAFKIHKICTPVFLGASLLVLYTNTIYTLRELAVTATTDMGCVQTALALLRGRVLLFCTIYYRASWRISQVWAVWPTYLHVQIIWSKLFLNNLHRIFVMSVINY